MVRGIRSDSCKTSEAKTLPAGIGLISRFAGSALVLALVSLWTACGGGSAQSNVTTPPPSSFTVTVTLAGSGSGTVTSSPSGINCPSTCSASFSSGTTVTLTATAASGSVFQGWGGDCTGTGTCTGSLTTNASVTATFTTSSGVSAVAPTFFALNDTNPADDPKADGMSYGAMSHPIKLTWNFVEQTKGVFDFTVFDQYAQVAPKDNNGVAILVLTLGMTPPWATSLQNSCSVFDSGPPQVLGCTAPPDNITDWTNFVQALINHYNGTTAPHIKYYEIWNEASSASFFTGSALELATLALAAYPIIKTDPNSFVIAPSMVGPANTATASAPAFLGGYLAALGGTTAADFASFHGNIAKTSIDWSPTYPPPLVPYPLPGEGCSIANCNGDIVSIATSYRTVLSNSGLKLPLFVTEGGFEDAQISDPDQRAAWLAQYYALLGGLYSSTEQVQLNSWFTWGGAAPTSGSIETSQHTPDEGGIAYNQLYSWLVGNTTAPCFKAGTIWTCNLIGAKPYSAQIIWDDSQTCLNGTCTTSTQSVSSSFVKYRDLTGTSHSITGASVPVGLKPILLENQ